MENKLAITVINRSIYTYVSKLDIMYILIHVFLQFPAGVYRPTYLHYFFYTHLDPVAVWSDFQSVAIKLDLAECDLR